MAVEARVMRHLSQGNPSLPINGPGRNLVDLGGGLGKPLPCALS